MEDVTWVPGGPLKGKAQPTPNPGSKRLQDCHWAPCLKLIIPSDWLSGVYLAKLTEHHSSMQSYVIFIVKDQRQADFMFQCSDHTWQAYNRWPNQFSLYDNRTKPMVLGRRRSRVQSTLRKEMLPDLGCTPEHRVR